MNEQQNQDNSRPGFPPHSATPEEATSARRRVGWNGLLAREMMSPGGALTSLLLKAANTRGQQLGEMARELGVTYGYIAQLRTGHREVQHISRPFAQAISKYLTESFGKPIPPILVMLIAGRIRIEDWLPIGTPGGELIQRGLERLAGDPMVGGMMPAEVWDAEPSVKRFVLSLYDEASSRDSLETHTLPGLLDGLLNAAIVFDELEQKLSEQRLYQDQTT
jgi:hypothetical protein